MTVKNVLTHTEIGMNAEVGKDIGLELGMKMVKDYVDHSGDKSNHFVGKNILIKVLEQPNCVGIRIFKALDEFGAQTYVIIGIDQSGKAILEYPVINPNGELSKELGIVADKTFPVGGWYE